ncbi:MAG: PIG-L family deacetylase [Lachnospiraceae bacterium]|nr:PIG-L family deacetylase [Lachnospiraceae bacterium]
MKKVLVISPHPDDELNLVGSILPAMIEQQMDVYVVYTTNGDAERIIDNKRIQEAIDALAVYHVPEDHVIFLGYANDWQFGTHIYHGKEGEVFTSHLKKVVTNGIESHPEYCFQKKKIHHDFTRENLKADLKDVMGEILADVLICVDYDPHPDHRATSLLFEEILGEMLHERTDYHPTVLKKFAYQGVWYGPKDYYTENKTVNMGPYRYASLDHDVESPGYLWSDRIAFQTDGRVLTKRLKESIAYQSAARHRHTVAWHRLLRIINADAIYWWRQTESVLYQADIEVSSGNAKHLTDFKTFDTGNVLGGLDEIMDADFCWKPDKEDIEKKITIKLKEEKSLSEIIIYEDLNPKNHIKSLQVTVGEKDYFLEPNRGGVSTRLYLDEDDAADEICMQILEYEGNPGLAEIEAYESVQEWREERFPIPLYHEEASQKNEIELSRRIEQICLDIKYFFVYLFEYSWKRVGQKIEKSISNRTQ